jgi:hypothetical protein
MAFHGSTNSPRTTFFVLFGISIKKKTGIARFLFASRH